MVDSGAGDEDDDDDGGEEEGNGCFDLGEITEICKLTFKDFKGADDDEEEQDEGSDSESGSGSDDSEKEGDILTETAKLQARSIFELLGYDLDDEIPIEVFKDQIFNGDDETRAVLRQFCCLD